MGDFSEEIFIYPTFVVLVSRGIQTLRVNKELKELMEDPFLEPEVRERILAFNEWAMEKRLYLPRLLHEIRQSLYREAYRKAGTIRGTARLLGVQPSSVIGSKRAKSPSKW